jgi:hypothetical protein
VGYFASQTDRTNTFQLLLVQPTNGVAYAVMNYDQIQWESGNASGGSGGLGGTPAAAGYSIGQDAGETLQVSGSLMSGALIDGGSNALISHSHGSSVLGRYVYQLGNYVALGDSYSSGESLSPYDPATDLSSINQCHRALSGAWPQLLAADATAGPGPLTSYACSGAVLQDLIGTAKFPDGQWNEGGQLSELAPTGSANPNIGVVTVTIGGNDVGFKNTLSACLHGYGHAMNSCQSSTKTRMDKGTTELTKGGNYTLAKEGIGGGLLPTTCKKDSKGCLAVPSLAKFYARIRQLAPNAAIRVLGYPKLFAMPSSTKGTCRVGQFASLLGTHDYVMNNADVKFLIQKTNDLNATIANQVSLAKTAEHVKNISFVDVSSVMSGHELCSSGTPWLNGLYWDDGADLLHFSSGSFHPNASGQSAIETAVAASLSNRTL